MKGETVANNKRIAINSLLLYFRMLVMMLISLYTSRVILETLGVEDFGIYNVVGGVITILGFITGSLGGASSRFLTYDMGIGEPSRLRKTFGNILFIHLLLAGLVIVVGETIGLWFMNTQLKIPETRMDAAFWVYQFSILSSALAVISIPYNACIIAHEKMSAFAWISIIDAVLKLVIVYLLLVVPYDKLIVYSILLFGIQLIDRIVYGIYCNRHFEETRCRPQIDREQFKEIFAFAGWTMNGCLAVIGYTQGLNILLNIFFGPIVNAARAIAVQVQNLANQFCQNFQMALNPQLTKSYASGDYYRMANLLKVSSKFSFFLILLICLPIMIEAETILKTWLKDVPEHTVQFVRLILCITTTTALSNPIVTSVHATGKIKKFQIYEGVTLLTIVPISYILLKFFNIAPEGVFVVHLLVEIVTQYIRISIVLPMLSIPLKDYFYEVLLPITKVGIIAPILPIILHLKYSNSIWISIIICITSVICSVLTIYQLGCNKKERVIISERVHKLITKLY